MIQKKHIPVLFGALLLLIGLGCSAGTLLVRAPQPTATPTKTPRPIFTPTLIPSPTPTTTHTPTITPVPTDTPTPPPTDTPTPPPEEAQPAPTNTPAGPPPPTNTPAPPPPPTNTPEPTATPTPAYPVTINLFVHDTGGAQYTYITGSAILVYNASAGQFEGAPGYQLKVIGPGGEYISEPSGPGLTNSKGQGLGDDHYMNLKVEFSPYTPGHYRAYFIKGDQQMSPEVEFDLTGSPLKYVHIEGLIFQP